MCCEQSQSAQEAPQPPQFMFSCDCERRDKVDSTWYNNVYWVRVIDIDIVEFIRAWLHTRRAWKEMKVENVDGAAREKRSDEEIV